METALHFRIDERRVAHEQVDGEVIAIDFVAGTYFSMRATAAEIWQMLVAGAPVADIIERFETLAVNPKSVKGEIEGFVASLLSANLLEADNGGAPAPTQLPDSPGPYSPPELEIFEDMSDLIMLDPVHDVSDAGWPYRPGQAT